MKELIEIMEPFATATVVAQGESDATISAVLPSVLSLNHHLHDLLERTDKKERYLNKMVNTLKDSLTKRFSGIFVSVQMMTPTVGTSLPLGDVIYLIAAFLDPQFGLLWVDSDVLLDEEGKERVRMHVKGITILPFCCLCMFHIKFNFNFFYFIRFINIIVTIISKYEWKCYMFIQSK